MTSQLMLQLNPPLPLVTPKGEGLAWFVTDLGVEHDLQWTVVINATSEIWTFQNREVRADKNITMNRLANGISGKAYTMENAMGNAILYTNPSSVKPV